MAAAWTATEFRAPRCRIKMLAANTAKGGFFPGMFKKRVVPAVIKQPQAEKNHGDEQAKNDGSEDKIHRDDPCLNQANSANRTARSPVWGL